jgi:hypothetical protein
VRLKRGWTGQSTSDEHRTRSHSIGLAVAARDPPPAALSEESRFLPFFGGLLTSTSPVDPT